MKNNKILNFYILLEELLKHIEKNKELLYEQMVTLENPEEKGNISTT